MKITSKIIEDLIARDETVLISFYKEYATPLANYISRFVSYKEEAIDLAYDLLVDLPDIVNKYYHSIEGERGFTRWLYIVAKNRAVNYAIKNNRMEYVESLEENDIFSFVEEIVEFQIEDLEKVMKKELYQMLFLRYKKDYKLCEVARAMNLTTNQAKKRMVKAHKIARQYIMTLYKYE